MTAKILSMIFLALGAITLIIGTQSTSSITGAVVGNADFININVFLGLFFIVASAAVLSLGFYAKNNI